MRNRIGWLWLCLLSYPVFAGTTKLVEQGNAAYSQGDFEDAATLYQTAIDRTSDDNVPSALLFNLGTSLVQTGSSLGAMDAFERAAQTSPSPRVRSLCRYNQGTCLVQSAAASAEESPQDALAYFEQAAIYFRSALTDQPSFEDAAYNLELALQEHAKLQAEQEEEQEGDQEQNDSDPGDQDGEGESDPDEDYDMEDMSEDAEMYDAAEPFGEFSEYEEIRGVPPPNQNEMDILKEELQNQQQRKKKSGSYKPVDRDW